MIFPLIDRDAAAPLLRQQLQPGGQALGFSVLGPLAVAFCKWLHDRRAAHPAAGLYFLARDMYLMREVYGRVSAGFPPQSGPGVSGGR